MPLTLTQYLAEDESQPEEPITLQEAKLHLKVEHNEEDSLIAGLVKAAREHCETFCSRRLVTTTFKLYLDEFPDCIRLPRPPAIAVTSITYVDSAGATQTLSSSLYQVDLVSEPARVEPAYGQSWPSTRCKLNAITVMYTAGYGDRGDVPQAFKQAIKLHVSGAYYNRDNPVEETTLKAISSLLWPYRVLS